ncbi:Receptor-type tyrosine-protein phosphatase R [Schistosoma japonicum]|uniref:Receptor-type tyrosine-protein phosphatase R n=1 Tax=Schistosoma japonicum TaxID=6182 RepID=A0A4Z2CKJ5_SCHJA|nr:Receptor-type tyrosine-protein phosphatase R [Schistosoma japonicum]
MRTKTSINSNSYQIRLKLFLYSTSQRQAAVFPLPRAAILCMLLHFNTLVCPYHTPICIATSRVIQCESKVVFPRNNDQLFLAIRSKRQDVWKPVFIYWDHSQDNQKSLDIAQEECATTPRSEVAIKANNQPDYLIPAFPRA